MASDEQAVLFRLRLAGADQVQASAAIAQSSIQRIGDAASVSGTQSVGLGDKVFRLKGALTSLTQTAEIAGLGIKGMSGSFGPATEGAMGLMSVIGVGAGGGLLGAGLLLGLSLLTKYLNEESVAAKKASDEADKLTAKMRDLAAITSELQATSAKRKLWAEMGLGTATQEAYEVGIKRLENERALLANDLKRTTEYEKQRDIAKQMSDLTYKIEGYKKIQKGAKAEALAIESDEAYADIEETRISRAKAEKKEPKKQTAIDEYKLYEDNEKRITAIKKMEGEQQLEDYRALAQSIVDVQKAGDAAVEESKRMHHESEQRRLEEVLANEKKRQAERDMIARKSYELKKSFETQYVGVTAQATAAILSDLAKGKKIQMAAIAEMVGNRMIASGTQHEMEAAAQYFSLVGMPLAPGLMAAGLAEIAAGMTMVGASGSASSAQSTSAVASNNFNRQSDQYQQGNVSQAPMIFNINVDPINGTAIVEQVNKANSKDSSVQFKTGVVNI